MVIGASFGAKNFRLQATLTEEHRCVRFEDNVGITEQAQLGREKFFIVDADTLLLDGVPIGGRQCVVNVIQYCPVAVRWENVSLRGGVVAILFPVLVDVLVCDA